MDGYRVSLNVCDKYNGYFPFSENIHTLILKQQIEYDSKYNDNNKEKIKDEMIINDIDMSNEGKEEQKIVEDGEDEHNYNDNHNDKNKQKINENIAEIKAKSLKIQMLNMSNAIEKMCTKQNHFMTHLLSLGKELVCVCGFLFLQLLFFFFFFALFFAYYNCNTLVFMFAILFFFCLLHSLTFVNISIYFCLLKNKTKQNNT